MVKGKQNYYCESHQLKLTLKENQAELTQLREEVRCLIRVNEDLNREIGSLKKEVATLEQSQLQAGKQILNYEQKMQKYQ